MEIEYKDPSSSSSSSSLEIVSSSHKKRAGRKIFRETRHPIYRGVRRKNGGKWVCELREPSKKSRIWLGTFPDPEAAAVAHDVAALALRGDNAQLNFPDSALCLPRAKTASHLDIQTAAFLAARDFKPPASSNPVRFSVDKKKRNLAPAGDIEKTLVVKPSPDYFAGVVESSLENSSKKNFVSEICNSVVELQLDIHHETDGDSERCNDSGVLDLFVDEEELFNMPVLLDSMAEGMLLTPPAMKKGFSWSDEVEDDDFAFTLWG